ncbi:WASH complex subunit 2 isoform X2 [Folsomia candida]|uniref:WASH complex subunit 2 isoform X2 n=1 Tax=Folsomia candida TaxID=158441 RepID=UPI000B8F2591|nr:WASH complex subunit 2 isoform X2 [Folsomia candida]
MNASNEDEIVPTSDELTARTSSWTLACDNLLLNKLKKFSKDLEQTSSELNNDCQILARDTVVLQSKLHNVTNQFLALSSSQFIENRVQNFEEAASSVSSTSTQNIVIKKTKAEKEAELIAKMKKSIQIGISANSQSLNQESSQTKLALPYLIGSSKFFSSRYVGLVEDEFRIPRDLTSTHNYTDEPADINKSSSNHSVTESLESSTSTPGNMYIPVSNSSSVASPVSANVSKIVSNPVQQQPLLNQPVILQHNYTNEVPTTTTKPNAPAAQKQGNYFNDTGPPPPIDSDDSDDDFKPIVGIGGGGRLFVDDDDDGDIFNVTSLFPSTRTQNPFFNTAANIAPASRSSPPPPPDVSQDIRPNINSDVGQMPTVNDKIADSVKTVHHPHDAPKKEVRTPSEPKRKLPPGAVSIFGSVPPGEIPRLGLQQQQNTEPTLVVEEPETQLPGSSSKCAKVSNRGSSAEINQDHETTSHSSLTSIASSYQSLNDPIILPVSRTKSKGIYSDDSDDDLFSSKKQPPSSTSSSSLFKDNLTTTVDRQISSVDKPASKQKFRRSIFDDSDSEEDGLFSSSSSTSSKKLSQEKTKNHSALFPTTYIEKSTVSKNRNGGAVGVRPSLFDNDDDSDTDLFASSGGGFGVNKSDQRTAFSKKTDSIVKTKSEFSDKTNLFKASTRDKSLDWKEEVISKTLEHNRTISIKMETDEREETEHPAAAMEQQHSNKSIHLLLSHGVEASESIISQPVPDESKQIDTSNAKSLLINSETAEKISQETMKPQTEDPEIPPAVADIPPSSLYPDVPDNKSVALSDKEHTIHASKISQLKERLSASELKASQSKPTSDNNKSTFDAKANKIGKLEDKLTFGKADDISSSSTDISGETNSDKSVEKNSKIAKLKEQLASPPDSKPGHDALSTKLGGKSKVDVKKLALSLKINPMAMMPGAKPVKQTSLESPASETEVLPGGDDSLVMDESNSKVMSPSSPVKKLVSSGLNINPLAMMPGAKLVKQGSLDKKSTDSLQGLETNNKVPSDMVEQLPKVIPSDTGATISSDVDVKKLALGLNIKPMSMLPGAKPVKQKSLESPVSPDTEFGSQSLDATSVTEDNYQVHSNNVSPPGDATDISARRASTPCTPESPYSPGPIDEESLEENNPNPLLRNLAKGRAKIQFKRRPPSKKLLHSSSSKEWNDLVPDLEIGDPTNITENVEGGDGDSKQTAKASSDVTRPTVSNPVGTEDVQGATSGIESGASEGGDLQRLLHDSQEESSSLFDDKGIDDSLANSVPFSQKDKNALLWDEESDSDDIFVSASKKSKVKKTTHRKNNPVPDLSATFQSNTADGLQGSNLKGKINPIVAETIPASSAAIEAKKNLDDPVPSSSRGNEQKSLFLDDEEDIFANSAFVTKRKDSGSSSQANIPSTITAPPSMPSGNLPKQGKQKQGLFGSDSDSDDLFKASVSAKSSKPKTKPKDETSKSNKLSDSSTSKSLKPSVKSSAITNKSIFDDSSDEDLFASKSKKKTVP